MVEKQRGRPRSETARRAILEATRDLVTERGYPSVTIEAIAQRAGTGKQTIYRRWPSKSTLVADAVLEGYLRLPSAPIPDTGVLHADLIAWGTATSAALGDPGSLQVTLALAAAAADSEQEAGLLYEKITGPYRRMLVARLATGQSAGQLAESISPEAVADSLMGALLFRILTGQPLGKTLHGIVRAFVAA